MTIFPHEQPPVRIGLFGVGLDTYWEQFDGLYDRLSSCLQHMHVLLETTGALVVNAGLVDNADKAFAAGLAFKQQDVDLIFLYTTTYALSATILPVVRKAQAPVVVLNLSPEARMDYAAFNALNDRTKMTGEWLAHCGSCPVPEIANVFKRAGIPFHQVTGILYGDEHVENEIKEWVAAAGVMRTMRENRLGVMGHYYSGMLDIYTDLTLQNVVFGGHIEMIEVDELSALRESVSAEAIREKTAVFTTFFDMAEDCPPAEIERAAHTAVALDELVARYRLGSLAYYYKGSGNAQNERTMSSIILGSSLLTARHIPVAGEYEIKNAQAMKIMDGFGAGGSFTEYYAMDFVDDVVLMGHDGPCHPQIAEGKIKVRPLKVYHGKVGLGLSVEMSVKQGPVTLLSVSESRDGRLRFIVAEAESVSGPVLEIGNTNSRYRFPLPAREFVERWNAEGPAHHCAIGEGHIASGIIKLGKLLDVETVVVC
ncbi:MAG: arabinose isomerase [Mucilaginibacter polytrichastri]|nr:arabinose isomerase [Mucilaginibacter polytrichastri]